MIEIVKDIKEANCITHSGTMHADDVFATAFLELYMKEIKVIRVLDINKEEIQNNAIVYDIGRGKFDHHQKDALKRENGIIYSSVGLLWKEFGLDYLNHIKIPNPTEVFLEIDKDFIEGIDAIDNGIFPKIESNFKVRTTSDIIKLFNPSFHSDEEEITQFLKAVSIAKQILIEVIYNSTSKIIANKKIIEKIKNASNEVLILDEYMPYEETLQKEDVEKKIKFVIFPSNRGGYSIKTVAKSFEDKTARMEIPKEWAGLENELLEAQTKIQGSRFCHNNLFILTCDTLEQANMLVNKIFEYHKINK